MREGVYESDDDLDLFDDDDEVIEQSTEDLDELTDDELFDDFSDEELSKVVTTVNVLGEHVDLTAEEELDDNDLFDDDDDDSYVSIKLNDDERKLLTSSGLEEEDLTEEGLLELKEQSKQVVVNSSITKIIDRNINTYQTLSMNTINKQNERSEIAMLTELSKQLGDCNVPFLQTSHIVEIRKRIREVDGSIESSLKLFKSLDLPQEVLDDPLNPHLFHRYIQDVIKNRERVDRNRKMIDHSSSVRVKSFVTTLLANQRDALPYNLPQIAEKKQMIVEKLRYKEGHLVYTCANCKHEIDYYDELISFMRAGTICTVVSPLTCPDCDTVNIISNKHISKLNKIVLPQLQSLTRGLEVRGVDNAIIYYPSYEEMSEAMPDLFSYTLSEPEPEKEVYVNWEQMKKDFRDKLELIYDNKIVSSEEAIGIHNLAKIIASQSEDYEELKGKALASLIQELKSSQLNILSEEFRLLTSIPVWYRPKRDEFVNHISKIVGSDCIDSQGNVNYEQYHKDFDDYEKDVNEYTKLRAQYVKQLREYALLFGNTTISNISLTENDKANFLSDSELSKVLDYISDLMILTHLGENYLQFFRPRQFKGNVSRANASYDARLRNIKSPDNTEKLADNVAKFVEFFSNLACPEKKNRLLPSLFMLNSVHGGDFLDDIYKFAKALLNKDYYEAIKLKDFIVEKHNKTLDRLLRQNPYDIIPVLISQVPVRDVSCSKYDYYFSDKTLTEEQQNKIVNLYSQKKLIPSTLKGETFEEKYEYYRNLEDFSTIGIYKDEEFEDFVMNNYALLVGIKLLGSNLNYDDYVTHTLARDFLFTISQLTIEEISRVLFINKDICSLYLTSELDLGVCEFDYSKIIVFLYFKSTNIMSTLSTDQIEVTNEDDSVLDIKVDFDTLRSSLNDDEAEMRADVEGLEMPSMIVDKFFKEGGE